MYEVLVFIAKSIVLVLSANVLCRTFAAFKYST